MDVNNAQPSTDSVKDFHDLEKGISYIQSDIQKKKQLVDTKNLIYTHMYDRPLTSDEKDALTPKVKLAMEQGDNNYLQLEARIINDQIQNRVSGLDNAVSYIYKGYELDRSAAEENKKQAIEMLKTVMSSGTTIDEFEKQYPGMGKFISQGLGLPEPTGQGTQSDDAGTQPTGDDAGLKGVDTSGWDFSAISGLNSTMSNQVKAIATYRNAPLMRSTVYGSRIMGLVDQLNPEYDSTKYASIQKMRTSASSGAVANVSIAANTAINHIALSKDSFDKLGNSGSQDYNAAKNWALTHTPDFLLTASQREAKNALIEVKSEMGALAGEISKIYKNSTTSGASPSYQEIDDWQSKFDENMTPGQFDAFIKAGMNLMKGKLDPLQQQYQETMGRQDTTFFKQESLDTLRTKFPELYNKLGLGDYESGSSSQDSGNTYKGYVLPY